MHETITNPVIKDEVTFTQTAQSTNGRMSTLQVKLMPRGGTPMHYHTEFAETFIVTEGILTITLRNRIVHLRAGEKFVVEKKQWHRFSNELLKPVLFTTIIEPGSTGFENALRILYGLAGAYKTDARGIPRNPLALAVVSRISNMHVEGPAIVMLPVFAVLYFLALVVGYKRSLIRKYCTSAGIIHVIN